MTTQRSRASGRQVCTTKNETTQRQARNWQTLVVCCCECTPSHIHARLECQFSWTTRHNISAVTSDYMGTNLRSWPFSPCKISAPASHTTSNESLLRDSTRQHTKFSWAVIGEAVVRQINGWMTKRRQLPVLWRQINWFTAHKQGMHMN